MGVADRSRRLATVTAVTSAAVLLLTVAASASPAGLRGRLGAAVTPVGRCGDLTVIRTGYRLEAGRITQVTLDGVPAGCRGASLRVTLAGPTGTALAVAGPVPVTGSQVVLSALSANPAPTSVSFVDLHAVGR